MYIGIDCGAKGAIAFVDGDSVKVVDMPVDSKRIVSPTELYTIFRENIHNLNKIYLGIEEQSVKGNLTSRKSAFIMGRNYQAVINAVDAFVEQHQNISVLYIKPQQWKKTLGVLGSKDMSVKEKKAITESLINDVFPNADIYGKLGGLKDGRSDALAIAEYLRRKY